MKLFLILAGLFVVIFICVVPLKNRLNEYKVQKDGEIVTVNITYIPNCLGTRGNYFMKFRFDGKEYDKKVGCGYSDNHRVGESIKMKHQEGTDIFLFENENVESQFVSTGVLAIFGIGLVIYGFKRN